MTNIERQKLVNERRTGRGFLTSRYVLIVAIIEVFFRTNLGQRYYTFQLFLAGLVGLGVLRFWMTSSYSNVFNYLQLSSFDIFIGAYVLFGLYNLYLQKKNQNDGLIVHSWYVGDSRFAFVGKYVKARHPNLFSYVYVEPLIVLLLVLPIMTYSFFLGIGAIVGAGQLWYQNYRLVRRFRHDELDRQDGKIVAEHVASASFDQPTDDRSSPPPLPRKTAPPPLPLPNLKHEELSPMEVLERLNKKD